MARHLAFYGKGGVGTTTLVAAIGTALAEEGLRVLLVGSSERGDLGRLLTREATVPTVHGLFEEQGTLTYDTLVRRSYQGVFCIELGRPFSGEQGGAVAHALALLDRYELIPALAPDLVLYDVSGHVDRATHDALGNSGLERFFLVTTADFRSLATANTLLGELVDGSRNKAIPCGGLVPNGIASSFEEALLTDYAKRTALPLLPRIPRSLLVSQCELYGKTVIEASPLSNQSYFYRRLGRVIVTGDGADPDAVPLPLAPDELRIWGHDWGDRLHALENGLVTDGAAI